MLSIQAAPTDYTPTHTQRGKERGSGVDRQTDSGRDRLTVGHTDRDRQTDRQLLKARVC